MLAGGKIPQADPIILDQFSEAAGTRLDLLVDREALDHAPRATHISPVRLSLLDLFDWPERDRIVRAEPTPGPEKIHIHTQNKREKEIMS